MKDAKLRSKYYAKSCIACGRPGSDPAHIKTYATTLCDKEENIIPLCREHHQLQHTIGWKQMCDRFVTLWFELSERGYYFNEMNKLVKDVHGIPGHTNDS